MSDPACTVSVCEKRHPSKCDSEGLLKGEAENYSATNLRQESKATSYV